MRRTDLFEKTLMLRKIEGRKRRGQQRMRWHHRLNGHEFEQTLGTGDGQGGLACCSPWDHKESDTTEWLNWTGLNWTEGQNIVFNPFIWAHFVWSPILCFGATPGRLPISGVFHATYNCEVLFNYIFLHSIPAPSSSYCPSALWSHYQWLDI